MSVKHHADILSGVPGCFRKLGFAYARCVKFANNFARPLCRHTKFTPFPIKLLKLVNLRGIIKAPTDMTHIGSPNSTYTLIVVH